jgi:hypothetical protein
MTAYWGQSHPTKFYFQAYTMCIHQNEIYWGFTTKVVISKTNFGTDCQLHPPLSNKLKFNSTELAAKKLLNRNKITM